ncbi:MAG UNVERIFIED_CONTAM: helix-turn-helix domain-containing protein [Thermobifida fusca]
MGYELYRHVLNHAPADLSKEERLLLLAIADDANERTRLSRPGVGLLEHWTGMDAQAIKRALRKLASRGWEIRVPLARRGDGSPVYAFRGRRSTYRVPVFPPRTDHPMGVAGDLQTARMGVASEHQSGANGGHSCTEWGSLVNEMGVTSDPPSPHSPHYSSSARARETTPDPSGPREEEEEKKNKNKKTTETPRTPLQIILDATDATPTEADTLLGHLTRHHHISNLPAWLTTAATNGTLTQHLANHRRRTRPTRTELCPEHTRPVDLCPFCAAQRKEAS